MAEHVHEVHQVHEEEVSRLNETLAKIRALPRYDVDYDGGREASDTGEYIVASRVAALCVETK